MGEAINPNIIKLSFLKELQHTFQKEVVELIDIYLHDAKRKIANLYKALEESNLSNFSAASRELRQRSIDVGAIQFSYHCLVLEIAAQEMRVESLPKLISSLEEQFLVVRQELERIKLTKTKKDIQYKEYS